MQTPYNEANPADATAVSRDRKKALARAQALVKEAEKTLVRAERESDRLLTEARREAERVRVAARDQAAALVVDAVERAEGVVRRLTEVLSDLRDAEKGLVSDETAESEG